MNNDLISRSALRGIIETYRPIALFTDKEVGKNRMVDFCLAEIDNAPTIEAPCEQESELIKAYTKGFNTGVETVKNARLQGEWKKDGLYYVCSICGEKAPYCYPNEHERFIMYKSHFCPNCGADMRDFSQTKHRV